MGNYYEYVCDNCGWTYIRENTIFTINKKHEVNVSPLLFSTSAMKKHQPVSGNYLEYYCYNCGKIVKEFTVNNVSKNTEGFDDENIIRYIEDYDVSLKIIYFSDKFQKCLKCGKWLDLKEKRIKYFILKENDEFEIMDVSSLFILDAIIEKDDIKYKLLGKHYAYFCKDCRKQINKFIIIRNPVNYNDDEIKSILKSHTFDLTIYLERSHKWCPECGDELFYLKESSKCPECGKGKLQLENSLFMD